MFRVVAILILGLVLSVLEVQGDLPLSWPRGTYGLPMPVGGCPNHLIKWKEGTRYQDTDDSFPSNRFPEKFTLAGDKDKSHFEHRFCIKTDFRPPTNVAAKDDNFPAGNYCVYKKFRCPSDFDTGYIKWDDEDRNNGNRFSGVLPDGTYNQDTVIYFCCRNDGPSYNPITLPTDDTFILFPVDDKCQEVKGMTAELQWYKWDTENYSNTDRFIGLLPLHKGKPDIELAFCVYTKSA